MNTIYDWMAVVIAGGLIALFLEKKRGDRHQEPTYVYILAGAACIIGHYLGNSGRPALGGIAMGAAAVLLVALIRPPKG